MCGIFGYLGKDPKNFNKDKFDKLGIYNVERGKSSCGVSYDGEIYAGLDQNKIYYDFIVNFDLNPTEFPIVIGHTRQSSVGAVNKENSHPFGFGINKSNSGYAFIGCHNGTLSNYVELAKKYDVSISSETTTIERNVEKVTRRSKIDSEILLEIIYKTGNFKVLSEYIGGAALFWTDTNYPNVGYLFKGESKIYENDRSTSEERPLFVYVENKNSMYVSSIKDSLKTIGGKPENIINIATNTVYRITDGDFKNAQKIKISRNQVWQKEDYYGAMYGYNTNYGSSYQASKSYNTNQNYASEMCDAFDTKMKVEKNEAKFYQNIYDDIVYESTAKVVFSKLRYWSSHELLTGVCVWINGYGFFKMGNSSTSAKTRLESIKDLAFINGSFVKSNSNTDFYPLKNSKPSFFYFVEGVQMRTEIDFKISVNSLINKSTKYLDFKMLSNLSTHPIIDLTFSSRAIKDQNILMNGRPFTGVICPLGSDYKYDIRQGNLADYEFNSYGCAMTIRKSEDSKLEVVKLKSQAELIDAIIELILNYDYDTDYIEYEEILTLSNEFIYDEEGILSWEDYTEGLKDFKFDNNQLIKGILNLINSNSHLI